MNHTTATRNGNNDLISATWIMDSLRAVRDRLQTLPLDKLDDARDDLALLLSEAIGGLSAPAPIPTLSHDSPDFEDSAEWSLDDIVGLPEMTPIEVLARQFELPPIAGGAPDPSAEDLADYRDWCDQLDRKQWDERLNDMAEGIELDPGYFNEDDARAAGLAV